MTVIAKAMLDDHDRIKRLFNAFNKGPSISTGGEILEELKVHASIEEELAYPYVRETDPDLADDAEDAQANIADLIADIEGRDFDDPAVMRLMHQLEREFLAYTIMEERHVFPQLKQRPGLDPLQLGRQAFAMRQEMVADRPAGPNKVRLLALTGWGADGGLGSNSGWGANAGW